MGKKLNERQQFIRKIKGWIQARVLQHEICGYVSVFKRSRMFLFELLLRVLKDVEKNASSRDFSFVFFLPLVLTFPHTREVLKILLHEKSKENFLFLWFEEF